MEQSSDGLEAGYEARYCYSTDREEYFGDFDSREDALAVAIAKLESHGEQGGTRIVWTGVQKHPMHFLSPNAKRIGMDFSEQIDEWLSDDIAADDPIVKIEDPDAFGAALMALLERYVTFDRWAVTSIRGHEVAFPGVGEGPTA